MPKQKTPTPKASHEHTEHDHAHKHGHDHDHDHGSHHDHPHLYTNLKIERLAHSEIEISAEIPAEALEGAYVETVKEAVKEAELPGFRKGKAPEKAVIAQVGDERLLREAAADLIEHEYQHIIIDNHIEVIDRPEVDIMRLAHGNALAFKARVPVFPTFELKNYSTLAAEALKNAKAAADVTDADVEKVIREIVSIHINEKNKKAAAEKGAEQKAAPEKVTAETAPELTDALAAEIGPFKDAADLRAKTRENLELERAEKAKDQRRISIGESLVAAAKIDTPNILIESELNRMWREFEYDLSRMGTRMEDYLAHVKKTEADIRKEWRDAAYKKVCLQIILNRIALEEKIEPDAKEMEEQTAAIKEHYPDAPDERVRIHVETMLTNEAVFKFLEKSAEK